MLYLARARRRVARIAALEPIVERESDEELKRRSLALRYRARTGEKPARLAVEAFALIREAARRAPTLGLRHFDEQLIGGLALCEKGLAEMQTGEGKTLTASLPLYLFSLYGRGAHLATANDYLARRDAEWIGPAFKLLGLSIGVVNSNTPPDERRRAYACDITYGPAKEFGFDFLRDRLTLRRKAEEGGVVDRLLGNAAAADAVKPLQREPYFMLVDEADSVLIDDAGTPLIIATDAGPAPAVDAARYRWAGAAAERLTEKEHYLFFPRERRMELTALGRQVVRALPQSRELADVGWRTLYEDIERAVLVARLYKRERQYVVRDGQAHIVDESTGRIADGRKWRQGIHQAVEAQEGLEITRDGGQAARITVQDFFLRYRRLCGMTGTVAGAATEFRRIYKLRMVVIPTHKPTIRYALPTRVFGTAEAKWEAVVDEVRDMHQRGRPVLVGTRSIDQSEQLSRRLGRLGIDHQVLNASYERQEAEIIKGAGECGRVTVATNMAGRGTDIHLGPGASELGGLHVIVTEMHDAARVDRQLIGRCGRQGDPGTSRIFLSLEDDLLRDGLGIDRARRIAAAGKDRSSESLASHARLFQRAQRKIETQKFRQRKMLLNYERKRAESARPLGLDPCLDLPD